MDRLQLVLEARFRGRRAPLPPGASDRHFHQFRKMLHPLADALGDFFGSETAKSAKAIDAVPNLNGLRALKTPTHVKELEVGNWIAIAPGAAHDAKRAPPVLFARLMQMLVKDLNYLQDPLEVGFVFLGDEQDRKIVNEILSHFIGEVRYLNLAGRLNLWESSLSLAFCKSLLCNDTALAHASEAIGTPTCVLFGPTVEAFGFGPWATESRNYSASLGCRPCSKHGKIPCRFGDKKCFSDILLRPIAFALREHLRPTQEKLNASS
jgi:ADP-heptose:LPS heptosyltransferase